MTETRDGLSAFILQNDGNFSVYDVKFNCVLNHVEYVNGGRIDSTMGLLGGFDIPELASGNKTTAVCLGNALAFTPMKEAPQFWVLILRYWCHINPNFGSLIGVGLPDT